MSSSESTNVALGYIGGIILAGCTIPQVYKMFMTRSADDVSYGFLMLYLTGISFTFAYLVLEGAAAAWRPMCVEITLGACTLIYKAYLDFYEKPNRLHSEKLMKGISADDVTSFYGGSFKGAGGAYTAVPIEWFDISRLWSEKSKLKAGKHPPNHIIINYIGFDLEGSSSSETCNNINTLIKSSLTENGQKISHAHTDINTKNTNIISETNKHSTQITNTNIKDTLDFGFSIVYILPGGHVTVYWSEVNRALSVDFFHCGYDFEVAVSCVRAIHECISSLYNKHGLHLQQQATSVTRFPTTENDSVNGAHEVQPNVYSKISKNSTVSQLPV